MTLLVFPLTARKDAAAEGGDVRLTGIRRPHVLALATGLIVIQLGVHAWLSLRGSLYSDDFALQSLVSVPGRSGPGFLLDQHDGHLMPGGLAIVWLTTRVAPLAPIALTIELLLLQAAVSALVLWLLVRAFGTRPLILVPFGLFLFSPLTLPSGLWWAAAVNILPMEAAFAIALGMHMSYLRTERLRYLAGQVGAVAVGLAFFEKSLLIIVGVVLATLVLAPGSRATGTSWIGSLWRLRWLWRAYAVLSVAYLVVYLSVSDRPSMLGDPQKVLLELLVRGLGQAVVPAAVGGPVDWVPTGNGSAVVNPPLWLIVAAAGAMTVGVLATSAIRTRARRAWLAAAAYILVDLFVIQVGRGAAPFAPLLPLALRYTADGAVFVALILALVLMPLRGEAEEEAVADTRRALARNPVQTTAVATVAAGTFLLLCLTSSVSLGHIWSTTNTSKQWLVNMKRSLAAAPQAVALLPQTVPDFVLFPLSYPDNLTSRVFAAYPDRPPFATQTSQLQVFDREGVLRPGVVNGIEAAAPPLPGCWRIGDGAGLVRLAASTINWQHTLHLSYMDGSSTDGTVQLGSGPAVAVRFERGLHDVYVVLAGGGDQLKVTLQDPAAVMCIGATQVGQAEVVMGP